MQTFLPYPDFKRSAQCLDDKRLGKQRVEAYTIIRTLQGLNKQGWANHPAVKMWRDHVYALKLYMNECIDEWIKRGFNNNMAFDIFEVEIIYPDWFSDEDFHASHRSNLLRKDYNYYSRFGWSEPPDLPYIWPVR